MAAWSKSPKQHLHTCSSSLMFRNQWVQHYSNKEFLVYTTHTVAERGVTAGLGQQQLDDLDVAVLAGAHQRRRALVVLDVDVGAVSQQGSNHVHPAVTDRQHQPRLAGLRRGQKHSEQTGCFQPPRRRVHANINSELKRFH